MNLPAAYTAKKYPLYELIGAGILLILLIIRLTKAYIRFDWLPDTLWLASGALLVLAEITRDRKDVKIPGWIKADNSALLFCLYLFIYHFWGMVVRLKFGSFELILYIAAAAIFAVALFLRAKDNRLDIFRFEWKKLIQSPAWPITAGIIFCLLSVFFPMTKMVSLRSMYGMQFGYDVNYGWGYNNWGYNFYSVNIVFKGYLAHWGSFAAMLMLFMVAFHIVRAAGKKNYPAFDLFFKIGVAALLAWWLLGAKGYESMKSFGNILFILSLLLLTLAVYVPDKLDDFIKMTLNKAKPAVNNTGETKGPSVP